MKNVLFLTGRVYAHFARRATNSRTVQDRALVTSRLNAADAVTTDRQISVACTDLPDNAPDVGLTVQVSVVSTSSNHFEQYMVDMYGEAC